MLLPLDQAPLERIVEIDKSDLYQLHMLQYKKNLGWGRGHMHTKDWMDLVGTTHHCSHVVLIGFLQVVESIDFFWVCNIILSQVVGETIAPRKIVNIGCRMKWDSLWMLYWSMKLENGKMWRENIFFGSTRTPFHSKVYIISDTLHYVAHTSSLYY